MMKAILFDFNGTLFDDSKYHVDSWKRFMRKRFGEEMSDEQVRREFIGPSNMDIFRRHFGEGLSEAEMHALSLAKEAEYRESARADANGMRLIDGAPEMFDMLVARGVPFALATASEMPNVEFYLNELGLKKWFALERVVYEEGKLASKPDPAFYIEAARRLGVSPADCLIVEDTKTGIEAAHRAGAGRIVAMDRTLSRAELEADARIFAVIHDFWSFERFI